MCVLTSHTTQPQPIRRTGNGNILVLWSLPVRQTLPRILAPEQTETIKTNKLRMKESQVRTFRAYHNHYRKLKLHTSEA